MEEKNFTLILADGTEIAGEISGNNLITPQEVSIEELDDANLIGAKLNNEEMENMTCCNLWEATDGTHIIFRKKSLQEIKEEELNAKIEYLAMMTDVELD